MPRLGEHFRCGPIRLHECLCGEHPSRSVAFLRAPTYGNHAGIRHFECRMKKQPLNVREHAVRRLLAAIHGKKITDKDLQEECDLCGRQTEIRQIVLVQGNFICSSCANAAFLNPMISQTNGANARM